MPFRAGAADGQVAATDAVPGIERAIWRVARQRFGDVTERRAALAQAIRDLSAAYNAERSASPSVRVPCDPPSLLARLVFFTVADLPKAIFPLAELRSRVALPAGPLRVMDLGSGSGTMSLGLLATLAAAGQRSPMCVDAVDRDPAALAVLPAVMEAAQAELGWERTCEVRLFQEDVAKQLPGEAGGPYDLILAGNLLNELPPDRGLPVTLQLLDRLSPQGALLIVEPALRATTRALHALRDEVLARGAASVFAPCTRQGPCPALHTAEDWCHECRPFQPPPELRQLAAMTGLRRRQAKWSYVVLNRSDARIAPRPGALRVVSDGLKSKGKLDVFLCGEEGRKRATLLSRHRSPSNEAFRHLARGSLAWIDGDAVRDEESIRLQRETQVLVEDLGAQGRSVEGVGQHTK
jgi:ribosomal protein RSM22 (predicted rRNA methylase)